MRITLLLFTTFIFLVSCGVKKEVIPCPTTTEEEAIKKHNVLERWGYEYIPGSDSLTRLRSKMHFNSNGQIVKYEQSHDNFETTYRHYIFTYDESGRKIEEYDSQTNQREVYHYNECRLIKTKKFDYDNQLSEIIKYSDSADVTIATHYNPEGEVTDTCIQKYDEHGNLVSSTGSFKEINTYNSKGLGTEFKTVDYNGTTYSRKIDRDESGLMIKAMHYTNEEYIIGYYYKHIYRK